MLHDLKEDSLERAAESSSKKRIDNNIVGLAYQRQIAQGLRAVTLDKGQSTFSLIHVSGWSYFNVCLLLDNLEVSLRIAAGLLDSSE